MAMAINVIRMMCPSSKFNVKCPYTMSAEYITVHNTANNASAKAEISYMIGNNNQVSYHVAVDDKYVVQGIEFNRNTWNAGDGSNGKGNRKSISIEICYSTGNLEQFKNAEKLAAKYIAYLLKQRNWGIDRVKKHQDWSGKYCPHKTLDLGWERFLNLIRAELGQAIEPTQNTTQTTTTNYTVKINTADLNVRRGAGVNYPVVKTVHKNEVYTIVEEKMNGTTKWGKLKSGAGWISLAYTIKTAVQQTTANQYYPACSKDFVSIVSALKSIKVDSSFANRKKIAVKNGIYNYSGTAVQNNQMLTKLKAGKLRKI